MKEMPRPIFLETERLVLRDKRADDLDFIAALYADPRVMRWIGDGTTYGRDEVEARLGRAMAFENEPGHERWDAFKIIERKSDGAPLGQGGMLRCEIDGEPDVEIGWWLAPAAWGHGYATEAALALRDWTDRRRLISLIQHGNERSVRVAEKLGERYEADVVVKGVTTRLFALER